MNTKPLYFSYKAIGTNWQITIWDDITISVFNEIQHYIIDTTVIFEQTYSRFISSSVIQSLTKKQGVIRVPLDLVNMLRLYEKLYDLSDGKCNPLIGFTLNDLGYDNKYSLKPKTNIRPVPDLHNTLHIIDDNHIELSNPVLIDLGAIGKGYLVDKISYYLLNKNIRRFLINGSGDIFYKGNGKSIRCGLEHPTDETKVIGVIKIKDGALCASAGNRRNWDKYNHIINPYSLTSTHSLLATWIIADNATLADGLATCLFLEEPTHFTKKFQFEYCILNNQFKIRRSTGFDAILF